MLHDRLVRDLYTEICAIPLIDPHSHIDPRNPTSKSLDDILGYHYYTELAHSAGMSKDPLSPNISARERVRTILSWMGHIENTIQYSWFLEIAKTFLGWPKDTVTADDAITIFDKAQDVFLQPTWEKQVFEKTKLERIFLTNEFDDDLTGFDTNRYVPCLRTDTLVFGLHRREVRDRLTDTTGMDVRDWSSMKQALSALFDKFKKAGAKACAISLPPDFKPTAPTLTSLDEVDPSRPESLRALSVAIFWELAERCREFSLPFDLMIGVNRNVYKAGVHQGQDLFDQRTSLIDYADVFNAFPEVTFPISVLTSNQNQELVSYSWIFPNVVTNGHWWYSNIPHYIAADCRARLQAVPKTKQIGYYSDAYKLEFVLPKYNMYRRTLAKVLAEDFVRAGMLNENQAVSLAKDVLRENVRRIFNV